MLPVLVLYATREGQSRRIAEHAAARLRRKGLAVQTHDARALPAGFALSEYVGVLLVAPVHVGRHPKEMLQFLRAHRTELTNLPSRLLSVSLSQAGVENALASSAQRSEAAVDVQGLIAALYKDTGFCAGKVSPVAGALAYRQYSFFKRMVMRYIASQAGGATDTSRDHVYTDYAKLDSIVDEFAEQLATPAERVLDA
jgi:menaquinone-dependent protoporphyrinogen oxidase